MKQKQSHHNLTLMQANAQKAEALLKLLANAKRLMILCHLVRGEKSVGDLAKLVDLSDSALSQHLAKLRREGVLEARKDGQQVFYHIAMMEVEALLSTLYLIYCRT